jgi:hypothetical protein
MAGSAPSTSNWEAKEMTDLIGRNGRLTVTGEVVIHGSLTTVTLVPHRPQGINPAIFLLDLKVTREPGIDSHIVRTENLSYERKSSGHSYKEVDILFDGKIIKRIKVSHPKTLTAPAKGKSAKKKAGKKAA